MELLAPLRTAEEVEPLIDEGADSLYCGVLTKAWEERYGTSCSSNRRECAEPNFRSFDEVRRAVELAHARGAKVYFAQNAHYYSEPQYPLALGDVRTALDCGVDALIVADVGLMLALKEAGVRAELHASTGATILNAASAEFFRSLGASRVILERHLTVEEVRRIARSVQGVGVEVFVLNGRCRNVEGLCTFQHGLHEVLHPVHPVVGRVFMTIRHSDRVISLAQRLPKRVLDLVVDERVPVEVLEPCELRHRVSVEGPRDSDREEAVRRRLDLFVRRKTEVECGVCALWDLADAGVSTVKIIGRSMPTPRKLGDVRYVRGLLRFLEDERPSREEFVRRARKEHRRRFGLDCSLPSCYFPTFMGATA